MKTNICPITYETISNKEKYSIKGLKSLSANLKELLDFPYTIEEQLTEARNIANKMSIQGMQPKLSVKLNAKNKIFELSPLNGTYMIKPPSREYHQLPENEDLTMRLASYLTNVPLHGLLYCSDGSLSYFIKRFDRIGKNKKLPVEDFSQLLGFSRDTKYSYSMEKLIPILDQYCTFPVIEKTRFFTRLIFNYLVGNEDMHLKNFSLIFSNNVTSLAPAYDFINTTVAMGVNRVREQIALPINGKKNNLSKSDIIDYYGIDKLKLNLKTIEDILNKIKILIPKWQKTIEISFLNDQNKNHYLSLLEQRCKTIQIL